MNHMKGLVADLRASSGRVRLTGLVACVGFLVSWATQTSLPASGSL
jgi:hypothetical protein